MPRLLFDAMKRKGKGRIWTSLNVEASARADELRVIPVSISLILQPKEAIGLSCQMRK